MSSTKPASGFRKWMAWVLVPLYALFFAEAFIQIFMPTAIIPRYVTGAPYGVRVGMPNMSFSQTSAEMRVQIRTNSRGIRSDREYPYEKPAGTCRIVLFGDSLFVGYEVQLEDSFSYLLEKKLQAAGYKCEVINLAVSGFGTAEMLITLQNEGLKYHPDIVVFSSHVTDLDDNVRSSLYTLDEKDHLVKQSEKFLPGIEASDYLSKIRLYRWVVENSQFYSAVRERAAFYVKNFLVRSKKQEETGDQVAEKSGLTSNSSAKPPFSHRLQLRLMEEAKRVAEVNGARFCVLEIPFNLSRTKFARQLPDYDAETVNALHIFSPLPVFQAAADPNIKIYYEKAHGHLSPFGNKLLTDYFVTQLLSTDWLPKPVLSGP